jgi:hypothetical protein
MIPGYKDKNGYYVDPKSECCKAGIVYFNREANLYVNIPIEHEKLSKFIEFRCHRCNRLVSRTEETR